MRGGAEQPGLTNFDLFQDLDILRKRAPAPVRPVIALDMSRVEGDTPAAMQESLRHLLSEVYTLWYGRGVDFDVPLERRGNSLYVPAQTTQAGFYLRALITTLHGACGAAPVVLVDEYDTPIVDLMGKCDADTTPLVEVLQRFYRVLQEMRNSLHYVFLTGIAHLGHTGLFSALNILRDVSWSPVCATLCGFTQGEIRRYFAPHFRFLQERWDDDRAVPDDMYRQYNGYCFDLDGDAPTVCNPFTLIQCLEHLLERPRPCPSRPSVWPRPWANSGSSRFLANLLKAQHPAGDGIMSPETLDEYIRAPILSLEAPNPDILMLQTGYYTPRRYGSTFRLCYPSPEVQIDIAQHILGSYESRVPLLFRNLYAALRDGDAARFLNGYATWLSGMPYAQMHGEYAYTLTLKALCDFLNVDSRAEVHNWVGRADLVVLVPDNRKGYVFELKYNGNLLSAATQAIQRQYGRAMTIAYDMKAVPLNIRQIAKEPPEFEYTVVDLDWSAARETRESSHGDSPADHAAITDG